MNDIQCSFTMIVYDKWDFHTWLNLKMFIEIIL